MEKRKLIPNDVDHLDPGIKQLVLAMRARGLHTADSGDGVSKLPGGHWDREGYQPYDADDVIPCRHVSLTTTAARLADDIMVVRSLIEEAWHLDVFFVEAVGVWMIIALDDTETSASQRARMIKRAKRYEALDVVLTRVADDISDKTCPLADVWWWDDSTTMAQKIAEVLE